MNWNNIKDKRPDPDQRILVVSLPTGGQTRAWIQEGKAGYDFEYKSWYCCDSNGVYTGIDFWISVEDLLATLPK